MNYLSICSGIEAASVAWHPLGWNPVAFAEIDAFPSAVLAHHWPAVPNLGDLSAFESWPEELLAQADIVAGGTPCQGFSLAGLRGSLSDARGNLTLTYAFLIEHIDRIRARHGRPPVICVWENVPGVLNTDDNAFGCFLAALAGEDDPLQPPGGRWTDAGYVRGPRRAIAWRCFDAQYFGVAQRRERVFALASAGAFRPEEVLFELEGLRRDSPPRRETGEGIADSLEASLGRRGGQPNCGSRSGHLIPHVCPTLRAGGNLTGGDRPPGTDVDTCESLIPELAPAVTAKWAKGSGGPSGDECQNLVAVSESQAVPVHTTGAGFWQEGFGTLRGREQDSHENQVAFSCKDHGADAADDIAPTLRSMGHDGSHANGGGQLAIAFTQNSRSEVRMIGGNGDISGAVTSEPGAQCQNYVAQPVLAFKPGQSEAAGGLFPTEEFSPTLQAANNGSTQVPAVIFQPRIGRNGRGYSEDVVPALGGADAGATSDMRPCVATSFAVRRLTPTECARLQGFPDHHARIPWRGKPAGECPDGPQYKAYGNSWATPVARWIGERIQSHLTTP